MTKSEHLIWRWSRRKREAAAARRMQSGDANEAGNTSPETDAPAPESFDPAQLPPIESITAGTDIRAFLQSGVPPALTHAALRRAWVSEPGIRDFIGIAENQWDFNDPTAIPGFEPLRATDDVLALGAQALGTLPGGTAEEAVAGVADPQPGPTTDAVALAPPAHPEMSDPAVDGSGGAMPVGDQHPPEVQSQPRRRIHGSALPKKG
jgi:hypothetical protein